MNGFTPSPDISIANQCSTSLESLQLQFFELAVMASRSGTLLSQIPSLSVEEMTFTVSGLDHSASEMAYWHTFAQALSQPQFRQFRTMTLRVLTAPEAQATVTNTIKAKLLECNARDIIVACSWFVYSLLTTVLT
jgi:hypothetical protein